MSTIERVFPSIALRRAKRRYESIKLAGIIEDLDRERAQRERETKECPVCLSMARDAQRREDGRCSDCGPDPASAGP